MRGDFEQLVARVVAQRVVDDLEAVQVDEEQSHPAAAALGLADGFF
jgi:hypothetical protein